MSDEVQTIIPSEVRTVDFYGDEITGAQVIIAGEPRIYVPAKPICDYLGVDWSAQRQRILRDPVLAEGMVVITMPSTRGPQPTSCLPLDLLPGFLFGIATPRVKNPEIQEKIDRYRRECFRILWDAFRREILPFTDLAPTQGESGAALAYQIATAVQHMARQQMEFERRLNAAGRWAKQIEGEISALKLSVGPRSPIDDEQAAELAQAVRNVGYLLEQRSTGDYRGVYSELYKTFGISSYKNLPREKFERAIAWLHQWYTELRDNTAQQG